MKLTKLETDDTFMELTNHGTPEFPFEYYLDEIEKYELGYIPLHWHREFEILFVRSGEIDCHIGDGIVRLSEGEGMFINSNVFHQFHSAAETKTAVPNILFAPEFFAEENSRIFHKYVTPFVEGNISHMILRQNSEWQRQTLDSLKSISILCENTHNLYELEIQEKIIGIWRLLCGHMDYMELKLGGYEAVSQSRMKKMVRYIEQNYMEKLTLADIAQASNISKSEALRCFKKCADISPVNYLLRYRLRAAGKMLCRTKKSVSEIAVECGFDNTGYFDRMFRQIFGITPSEYRKTAKTGSGRD